MRVYRIARCAKDDAGLAPIALLLQVLAQTCTLTQPAAYITALETWDRYEAGWGNALGSFARTLHRQSI